MVEDSNCWLVYNPDTNDSPERCKAIINRCEKLAGMERLHARFITLLAVVKCALYASIALVIGFAIGYVAAALFFTLPADLALAMFVLSTTGTAISIGIGYKFDLPKIWKETMLHQNPHLNYAAHLDAQAEKARKQLILIGK